MNLLGSLLSHCYFVNIVMTSPTMSNNPQTNDMNGPTMMEHEYNRLVQKLQPKLDKENSQFWIGVAGGPGSGKTTVAQEVARRLNALYDNKNDDVAIVIGMDGWHIPQTKLLEQFGEELGMKRRGAPWTFDVESMIRDLSQAKRQGEAASLPAYSREISDPVPGAIQLGQHHKIVLVEGIYLLMKDDPRWGQLYSLWDDTWFIQSPSRDEQITRLVQRSLKTWTLSKAELWGPGPEGARKRAEYNDVPNMDLVAPCSKFANEIIITKK